MRDEPAMNDDVRRQFEQLIAFADGDLSPAESQHLEALLASSAEARQVVNRYRHIASLRREDDSVAPSSAATARAKAIFSQFAPQRPISTLTQWLEAIEEIIATLVFDSRTQAAAIGLRGAAGTAVQLSFEAAGFDIDIEIESDAENPPTIIGQVSVRDGTEPPSMRIGLARKNESELITRTRTDAHGGFIVQAETGQYDLYLVHDDGAIVFRDLEVHERAS